MFYKISKYNPNDYDENGKYRYPKEWTGYSDINKKSCFPVLTRKEYERVEELYLKTIEEIAISSKTDSFEIRRLERWTIQSYKWRQSKKYHVMKIKSFIRDCLRNRVWGVIVGRELVIDVGYDFYVHVQCNLSVETVSNICANSHLYCVETEFYEIYDVLREYDGEEIYVPVGMFGNKLLLIIAKVKYSLKKS